MCFFTDTPANVDVLKMIRKYMCSVVKEKQRNKLMSCDISFLQMDKVDLQANVDTLNTSLSSLESDILQLQKENKILE